MWHWCFFFAGIAPIQLLGAALVHMCFLVIETQFFTLRYAFYYAVSIKVIPTCSSGTRTLDRELTCKSLQKISRWLQ